MSTKTKQSTGGTALLVLAVLFIALVILNQALVRGLRLDLTEGRLYTLSDGTVEVLSGLSEPVNLYLFYSDRAARDFAPLQTYASRVEEMLEEFERESDGMVRVETIEPLPFSEEEDLASGYGLQAVSPGGTGDPIYFGLAGTNAVDDLEVIEFFQLDREAFLEYDLARLVYSLANPDQPVLGLITDGRKRRRRPRRAAILVAGLQEQRTAVAGPRREYRHPDASGRLSGHFRRTRRAHR